MAVVVVLGRLGSCGLHLTLHWGDVVAKWTWVVVGRRVEVVGGVVGVVVVVEEDTSQRCDFGITFNIHVKSTNLFGRISNKCYWKLVIQT